MTKKELHKYIDANIEKMKDLTKELNTLEGNSFSGESGELSIEVYFSIIANLKLTLKKISGGIVEVHKLSIKNCNSDYKGYNGVVSHCVAHKKASNNRINRINRFLKKYD